MLDPGDQRLLAPSLVFGMYILPIVPTMGADFKDSALREQCVTEIMWMEYMMEPH